MLQGRDASVDRPHGTIDTADKAISCLEQWLGSSHAPYHDFASVLSAMERKGISVSWLIHGKCLPKRSGEHQALIPHIRAVPRPSQRPPVVRGSMQPPRRTAAPADSKGVCLQEGPSLCLASGKWGDPLLHGSGRSDCYHWQPRGQTLVFVLHQCQG